MSGDLKEKLRGFILENFLVSGDGRALDDQQSLLDTGVVDSTGVLEMVQFLEQEFGVRVGDEELIPENLDSVANLERFIQSKLAAV